MYKCSHLSEINLSHDVKLKICLCYTGELLCSLSGLVAVLQYILQFAPWILIYNKNCCILMVSITLLFLWWMDPNMKIWHCSIAYTHTYTHSTSCLNLMCWDLESTDTKLRIDLMEWVTPTLFLFYFIFCSEKNIKHDNYLVPFTTFELGLLHKQKGDISTAITVIESAK